MIDWRQYTIESLKDLNIRTKKSLGQNFLIRYRVAYQIVKSSGVSSSDHVLEIGGGLGILSEAIIKTGCRLTIIEKDTKLAQHLRTKFGSCDEVTIIEDDALLCKWPANVKIISNLPYSISTPILDKVIHYPISDATLMLQKEVAKRCLAKPKTNEFSRLTILCNIHTSVRYLMDVSPKSFYPSPAVSSAVLTFKQRESNLKNDHSEVELLTRNLFSLRRRIVRSVIRGFLKRTNKTDHIWEFCPYKSDRVFSLTVSKIDEILTHLKEQNAWPLT